MIPVLELEKSGDARFGNGDSRLGTYEKEVWFPNRIHAVCMAFSSISAPDLETVIPIREHYNFFYQNLSSSVFRVKGI